ncbi:SDR family NAD(P)-dependent oxidoreductase [Cucumibacter marinus]|uniref:SDR family NAD(P)-dependent oxidoreductase n=1 Tax=Cucumibacter marinus TaxID=1121252 RepID=UPI0003FE130A|nr:SDR family NAD(P)-dependent oxidoreductase [Cucumibacter marinus]
MTGSVLDKFRLDGKRAMITGSGRGLGRQMALALSDAGASLVLVGRGAESIEATAGEIAERGGLAETIVADVTKTDACTRACEAALANGPVDILINNVGGRSLNIPIAETSAAQWREGMALNLDHYFLTTRLIGAAMIAAGNGGRIINMGSISGMIVNRDVGGRHYETAKAAVMHFTKAVAVDWAKYGITANAISPGLFMTDANRRWEEIDRTPIDSFVSGVPMGRPGEPEEIGPLAVYLASPASSYVTGASFVIDGGYTAW